jgi:hypothetical protein
MTWGSSLDVHGLLRHHRPIGDHFKRKYVRRSESSSDVMAPSAQQPELGSRAASSDLMRPDSWYEEAMFYFRH